MRIFIENSSRMNSDTVPYFYQTNMANITLFVSKERKLPRKTQNNVRVFLSPISDICALIDTAHFRIVYNYITLQCNERKYMYII